MSFPTWHNYIDRHTLIRKTELQTFPSAIFRLPSIRFPGNFSTEALQKNRTHYTNLINTHLVVKANLHAHACNDHGTSGFTQEQSRAEQSPENVPAGLQPRRGRREAVLGEDAPVDRPGGPLGLLDLDDVAHVRHATALHLLPPLMYKYTHIYIYIHTPIQWKSCGGMGSELIREKEKRRGRGA